ncbi:hypothetical protein Glove_426g38 [Diversispora epigaea]|uniref:Uncharacterized protein n=1 Tax=Diversispora epigaea TaxID=1348612 RepID=A0A397GU78_9GLOM|nr:hypothetical protein Glove_426g38 [Diversispora epigaea]
MSTDLQTKIYNFLINAEEDHITAGSVIYQVIEDNTWLEKNELRGIIEQAVSFANNQNIRGSSRHTTLLEILLEPTHRRNPRQCGVRSLHIIGAVKTNEERPLSSGQIEKNIKALKGKLKKNPAQLHQYLFSSINKVSISELTWEDPLASQVISDDSNLVLNLPIQLRDSFMVKEDHITAGSVIYQVIEDNTWLEKNELRGIIEQAVSFANNQNIRGSSRHTTLLEILLEFKYPISLLTGEILGSVEFEISYKTVRSLHIIGAVKTNEERPLSSGQIEKNIKALKGKLKKNPAQLHQYLFSSINKVSISELTWEDPLASQVISDDSNLVLSLPIQLRDSFMKPVRQMVPPFLPPIIQEKYNKFVENFIGRDIDSLSRKLVHNEKWKESNEELAEVASRILGTLNDTWNNQAFDPEFAKLQSEGTYVNNVILPAIRATLKCLPLGKSTFVSSSERQSSASADRKGNGRLGRRPDIMFVMKRGEKNYELLYAKCSRLTCTTRKEKNDGVKLWRETNDGMYWTRKSCKPDKDEFSIIGMQVAGKKLRLSVLIRDMSEVHRYYHLHESEILIQQSPPSVVTKFIETLLILRNVLIVNMSLLHNVSLPKSVRLVEDSSTIDSDN